MRRQYYCPLNDDSQFLYQKTGSDVDGELLAQMKEAAKEIGPEAYAWPEKKMFPIFNEKAAALSAWYAREQERLPSKVTEKIAEAMDFFDLEEEVSAPQRKEASIDADDWLFPEHQKVLISTPTQVKAAEELLLEQKDMPIITRTYGFRRLYQKAAELHVELEPDTIPYVGEGRCKVAKLCHELQKRRKFVREGEYKQAYLHLETQLRELDVEYYDNQEECDKLASFIHQLDQESGIDHRYNRRGKLGFADPVLAVFNQTKRANEFVNLAGNEIPIEQIAALDPQSVADIVGSEFLEDIQNERGDIDPYEMADVMNILPDDMKSEVYERLF